MTADDVRGELVAALYDLIVDHPMWIDGQGKGLDYSPEREARIGDFLEAAVEIAGKRAAEVEAKVQRVSLWADLLDDDMRALGYTDGHPAATAIRAVLDAEATEAVR